MENPFQPNEKVITKFKGEEVEATVVQTWNKEVQVKTADGVLRWRTAKTVWYPPKPEQLPPHQRPQSEVAAGNDNAAGAETDPGSAGNVEVPIGILPESAPQHAVTPQPAEAAALSGQTPATDVGETVASTPPDPASETASLAPSPSKKGKPARQKALLPRVSERQYTSCGADEDMIKPPRGSKRRRH